MIVVRVLICSLLLICGSMLGGCAKNPGGSPKEISVRADGLRKKGDSYLREGKYRAALQEYVEAEKLDPLNAELKLLIGYVYANFYHRPDDAIRYYREAIRLKEDYSEAYNNLGTVYLTQKEYDQAILMFQKALDNLFYQTPEFAYFNMARAYEEKGEMEMATEYYRTAIELKPNYIEPYIWLGLLYQREGEHELALLTFKKARSILEDRKPRKGTVREEEWKAYLSALAGVCYYQGQSLTKLGRFSEAREVYQKAMELAPEEELRKKTKAALDTLPPP